MGIARLPAAGIFAGLILSIQTRFYAAEGHSEGKHERCLVRRCERRSM